MHRIMNHDRAKISIGWFVFFFLQINVLPKWRHEYIGRSKAVLVTSGHSLFDGDGKWNFKNL